MSDDLTGTVGLATSATLKERAARPIVVPIVAAIMLAFSVAASAQPTFSKVFGPDSIGPGGLSTLTFTITNGGMAPMSNLAFTDPLPAGVTLATPANPSTTCADGQPAAPNGGDTVSFSDGRLGVGEACTVTVTVTSSSAGAHLNVSGDLTSSAGNSGSATDTLTVTTALPSFSKSFAPSSIPLGGRSTLTFTIDNSANGSSLTALAFTDTFPTGLEIAAPANLANTCGGAVTATPGAGVVVLSNGTIAAGATCSVAVDVTATGGGTLANVSGDLTSSAGNSGKAIANLDVTVTAVALR